eukprot:SAG31_NODE_24130_length_488_cov_1.321337_1_plen_94_part_10
MRTRSAWEPTGWPESTEREPTLQLVGMSTPADAPAAPAAAAGKSVDQYREIADTYQTSVTMEPLWAHTTDSTIKGLIGGRGELENKAVIDLACG